MTKDIQPSKAASTEQIAKALEILFSSMRLPKTVNSDKATKAYVAVCHGYPIEVISAAILKFLRGGFPNMDKRYCPTPPELSDMLRDAVPRRPRDHSWPEDVDPVTAAYKAYRTPTPEAKARVDEMMRKYRAGIPVNDEVARVWAKMESRWKSGNPAYVGLTKGTPPKKPAPKTEAELSGDWPQPDRKLFETIYMTKGIADDDVGKPRDGGT